MGIFGGAPTFATPLHVGRPNVADRRRFVERTNEMLERLWFSNNGPLVREFEREIARFLGARHCVCVCNATVGLELLIRAANLGGEVIVPSFTFVATAHALQWQEITPVFADMDPATHNLDPAKVERHITPRTTAILATHVWGRPCDVEALAAIAARHKLKLIFDAAHAFGCSYRGRMIGGFGLAEVFSFHATKFLNSFEGGAIVTNDAQLAEKVRLMTNFGFIDYDKVVHLGTNGKMTEVCAAMGLTNLERVTDLIATNARNYECYKSKLEGLLGVSIIDYPVGEKFNYQYIVIEVDPAVAALDRDELVAVLHGENVLARKYFWPGCHKMEPYRSYHPHADLLLGETSRVAARIMVLPTGQSITPIHIDSICGLLRRALGEAPRIRARLATNVNRSGGV